MFELASFDVKNEEVKKSNGELQIYKFRLLLMFMAVWLQNMTYFLFIFCCRLDWTGFVSFTWCRTCSMSTHSHIHGKLSKLSKHNITRSMCLHMDGRWDRRTDLIRHGYVNQPNPPQNNSLQLRSRV